MPHVEVEHPYGPMADYPHMGPIDESIWNRFIEKYPNRFFSVFYDFHVGEARAGHPDVPKNFYTGWYDLTRWKCDVVAPTSEAVYCIEVKPNANAKALGQAMAYAILYNKEQRPGKPVIPVVLTDECSEITKTLADELGVELWFA